MDAVDVVLAGFDEPAFQAVVVTTGPRGLTEIRHYADGQEGPRVERTAGAPYTKFLELLLAMDPFSPWNAINVPGELEYT